MHIVTLDVLGMHCGSCSSQVQSALRALPGVETADVNLAGESALVRATRTVYASRDQLTEVLEEVITRLGFVPQVRPEGEGLGELLRARDAKREARQERLRKVEARLLQVRSISSISRRDDSPKKNHHDYPPHVTRLTRPHDHKAER